jgi:hypothetical protein
MPVTLAPAETAEALNADPEFALAARYWNVRLRLFIGNDDYFVDVVDGVVVRIRAGATGFDSYTVTVGGPVDVWEQILATTPRPFYQDFWSAFMRHGFTISGDLELAYAYYGALRRMTEILRSLHNQGGSA